MKKPKNKVLQIYLFVKSKKLWILFLLFFSLFIFTRMYLLEKRADFSWDQATIAWAVKHLLVDGQLPLLGMPAKLNAGFSIGPLYYYYSSMFYALTNLDPIASLIIIVVTSSINFFIVFFILKKLFDTPIAFIGAGLEIASSFLLTSERAQWPVPLIPTISLLIFYALYKSITDKSIYIILLSIFVGLAFHIHFTAIFFPILIAMSIPLWQKNKKTLLHCLLGIGIIVVFLIPNIISAMQTNNAAETNLIRYLQDNFLMFHGRRFLYLTHDAFIQFDLLLNIPFIKWILPAIPILFFFLYYWKNKQKKTFVFAYLVLIWILVPWVAFTMYKGEITDYYFSITRPIAIICVSFLSYACWQQKNTLWKLTVCSLWFYYIYINTTLFFQPTHGSFDEVKKNTLNAIENRQAIEYQEGVPEAYFYYAYTKNKRN